MGNNDKIFNMLRGSLSEPRMATYLTRAGWVEARAVDLYIYNIRLAQAFLLPLGITEVVFRNAVDRVLTARYGEEWYEEFIAEERQDESKRRFNPKSLAGLRMAMSRAGEDGSRDDIIGVLTFDFFSNLFRRQYWRFWGNDIYAIFPNLASVDPIEDNFARIQGLVRDVNFFRNRVAHHEPILHMDANLYHKKMEEITGMICRDTAEWMHAESTVFEVLRARP